MIIKIDSTFNIHSEQFNSFHIWDLIIGNNINWQIRTSEKMTFSSICH